MTSLTVLKVYTINQINLKCLGRIWQTNMLWPQLKNCVWCIIITRILQAIFLSCMYPSFVVKTYHYIYHGRLYYRDVHALTYSWAFMGWATTWGNGRVSQSFWVLQNNSVVLKLLFCGIVWYEIQSYRKATCNFVVLTFIKKKTSPTRDWTWDHQIRSQTLYQMSYWGLVGKSQNFRVFIRKTAKMQYRVGAISENRGEDMSWA